MHRETKRRKLRRPGRVAFAAAALVLTGCAHNDVLVFGTSTTIGLNIQTASTQGAAPSIVLGFEREEAVWMPLVLNGRDSALDLCAANAQSNCVTGAVPVSQALYRSTITTGGGNDQVVQSDAYSVFASLGATFNGRGNTTQGAAAGGGLAQFFATGNAAINVSRNPALVTALKVESSEGAAAQANAVNYAAALTPEARASADADIARRAADRHFVLSCAEEAGKTWDGLVDASTLTDSVKAYLKPLSATQRRASLQGREAWLTPLVASATAAGCTRS